MMDSEYTELLNSIKENIRWVQQIECKSCGVMPGNFCRDASGRVKYYPHVRRTRDRWQTELDRKKQVRQNYLADWFLTFGDIFKES